MHIMSHIISHCGCMICDMICILQTLICVLVARPRQCLTLSNPVPWQNWMTAYLGYILRMRTLFRGWPITVNNTHTIRRRRSHCSHTFCRDLYHVLCVYTVLVAWHSGRTLVSDRRTFAVLRSTCGWRVTTNVGKPSAVGQPTRLTQPFVLSGVDKWVVGCN